MLKDDLTSMHFYDIEKGEIVDLVGGINDIMVLERLV
jgi:tRNA nucleotidyltransferase/poly(A) polymerase